MISNAKHSLVARCSEVRSGLSRIALLVFALAGCAGPESPSQPLEDAAAGDPARIAGLVAAGANPNMVNSQRLTPLAIAARAGQVSSIRELVEAGADPNLQDDRNGWTPLLHAVHKHQLESIETLLALGADPDRGTRNGYTPLMMAASYGDPEMVYLLLQNGADPRRTLKSGENALLLAATGSLDLDRFTLGRCQEETVRLLLEHDPGLSIPESPLARVAYAFVKLRGCDAVRSLIESQ